MNVPTEEAWNRAYLTGACAWDTRVPSPELLRRLAELDLPSSRVLEIGCGTGANAVFLARQGHDVVCIDFAASAVEEAKLAAKAAGVSIEFRTEDFLTFSGYEEEFDLAFDSGCYHTARQYALERYLEKLYAVLKPGGRCISLVGNSEDGAAWGPARVSAFDLLAEHHPFFELVDLRRFTFDSTACESRPLGWSALLRRRERRVALPSTVSEALTPVSSGQADLVERLKSILSRLEFGPACPWKLDFEVRPSRYEGHVDLSVAYQAVDRDTRVERTVRYERLGAFASYFTDADIIDVVLSNVMVVATHEVLESFSVDGSRLLDPHSKARFLDTRYAQLLTLKPVAGLLR